MNEKTVLMPKFLIQSPLFCFLVSIPSSTHSPIPSTQPPVPSTQPPVPSVSGLVTSYIYFFQKSFKFLVKMPVVTPKCLILSAFFFSSVDSQHPTSSSQCLRFSNFLHIFFQKSFKFLVKMPVVTPKCLILSACFFFFPASTRSTQHPIPSVSGLVTSCLYISKSFTFF